MADARLLDDAVPVSLLAAVSAANTAAATSGAGLWTDITNYVGDVLIVQCVGLLTGTPGSFAGKLQAGSDANGTGAADLGITFTSITTNTPAAGQFVQTAAVDAAQLTVAGKTFIGYVGTVTGFTAVLVAVALIGRKRIT